MCIPVHQLCDGKEHCPGGTDEGGRCALFSHTFRAPDASPSSNCSSGAPAIFVQLIAPAAHSSATTALMDPCAAVLSESRFDWVQNSEDLRNSKWSFQLVNKTKCEPENECLDASSCSQKCTDEKHGFTCR